MDAAVEKCPAACATISFRQSGNEPLKPTFLCVRIGRIDYSKSLVDNGSVSCVRLIHSGSSASATVQSVVIGSIDACIQSSSIVISRPSVNQYI